MKRKESEMTNEQYNPPALAAAVVDQISEDESALSKIFGKTNHIGRPIRSLTLKSTLTRPLLAAAHFKKLLFTCTGELYLMPLKGKSRAGEISDCVVVDGIDEETGEEATLMCNAMMSSAFGRAGYATYVYGEDAEGNVVCNSASGLPIFGHSFAFKAGLINEGEGYRRVDVVEVTIER
jgi:hypothetical protein